MHTGGWILINLAHKGGIWLNGVDKNDVFRISCGQRAKLESPCNPTFEINGHGASV